MKSIPWRRKRPSRRFLKDALAGMALVDGYDAYQALDDAWVGISGDLEVIQTEGKTAVRKVDPNMVVKKKNGKDVEVQDGWAGRILPFALVQEHLLAEDIKEISSRDSRLGEISQEIGEILESFDEEDKGILCCRQRRRFVCGG